MNRKMIELDSNYIPNTYKKSEKDADLPFWQELYERCFGTKEIKLEPFYFAKYPKMQGQGVDRRIDFKDRKSVYVEEKLSKEEHPRMFVEFYDDSHEDNKGWFYTINPDLCDYLVYGYRDTMKFYIIPFRFFQYTYWKFIDVYRLEYESRDSPFYYYDNDGKRKLHHTTKGWLIPWEEILEYVTDSKCIQLPHLAPKPPDESYKENVKDRAFPDDDIPF